MRSAELLLLLGAAALGLPAHADDTGWTAFPTACRAEMNALWAPSAAKGRAWEADSEDNLQRLGELTDRICPQYLQHPNDSDAIHSFSEAKAFILDHAPVVQKQGDELLGFLRTSRASYQATFSAIELDFSATPCGQHMQATEKRMATRLETIRAKVRALATTCFAGAATEAETHLANHQDGPKAQGAGVSRKTASPTGSGSDITGIEQDKAKQK